MNKKNTSKKRGVKKEKKTISQKQSFLKKKVSKKKNATNRHSYSLYKKTITRKSVGKVVSGSRKKKNKHSVSLGRKKILKSQTHKSVAVSQKAREEASISALGADALFRAKIKVIGLGGGGSSIVSDIGRSLNKAKFVVIDSDTRSFKKRKGIKYISLGQTVTHGLGTGLNPMIGKSIAEAAVDSLKELFVDQDMIILVASLGGGLGSGVAPVLAKLLEQSDAVSFGIFTMPFKFEGKNKQTIATQSLQELRKNLNVSMTIANEKIFKVIDVHTPITQAFSMVNKHLIESLESLIDLIHNPGIINIDFADLRAILGGRGNMAFLNTVEASGKHKLEKITKEILHNPLYQQPVAATESSLISTGQFIAEKILFNIEGGKQLSMLEVNAISKLVSDQNPKAKIIFGISRNVAYKDKIKVTILMSGAPKVKIISSKEPLVKKEVVFVKKSLASTSLSRQNKKKPVVLKKPLIANPPPVMVVPSMTASKQESLVVVDEKELVGENKKTIRRSALEIKKEEEMEVHKKTEQEREWEIPAFLRFKK